MYQVIFLPNALDDLSKLDKAIAKRIINRIEWFSENIENSSPIALKSRLSGFYKLRIGDWRVIYEISKKAEAISIHKIGHRKDIYE
ncbi:MAG: type II toxin-antitoxin system RelE/ParE family toxin [Deltaproteobacteria bacterium]|nr:type II toxin-antitoxin system RelE/ParE family toxin [Deltaproteobacteria bacterium]